MINDKLKNLYNSHIEGLEKIENSDKDLDGPLLMACWDELYNKARHKLLIVGQENYGWKGGAVADIEDLMQTYIKFDFAKNYHSRNTPFWHGAFILNGLLNPEMANQNCFLWTNVSKYCTTEGGPISIDDHMYIADNLKILPGELEATKPDVVVFLSGPSYDGKIGVQFDGELKFEPIKDEIPMRELARVIHPSLPKHTYRTYHPKALSFQEKYHYLDIIAEQVLGK